MTNIEKLTQFIKEHDPEEKTLPLFLRFLEAALDVGRKAEGKEARE